LTVTVPVSFLDLTPIQNDSSARDALRQAVELAQLADHLGYHRLWYAEHHNTAGLASAAPEIMIGHIAAQTSAIRVGSGGVMLPNHSPLKIAETFRLLEALFPGRIDLGLGRAPGTDTMTALAMRRSRQALGGDDYPEQLAELIAYDDESFPEDHPFRGIQAIPFDVKLPPLWLLGSSGFSAQLAAQTGLGFAFASHINRATAIPALRAYREEFVPSSRFPEPKAILAVSVTVGETAEQAQDLAKINDLVLLRLRTGRRGRYPMLEEAKSYQFSPTERAMLTQMPLNYLMGTAAEVREQIEEMLDASEADEVMLTSMLPEAADRMRIITSMAREFGLTARDQTTPFPEPVAATT
jgi:luciferase family oxidoreductase group 1